MKWLGNHQSLTNIENLGGLVQTDWRNREIHLNIWKSLGQGRIVLLVAKCEKVRKFKSMMKSDARPRFEKLCFQVGSQLNLVGFQLF